MAEITVDAMQRYCYCIGAVDNYLKDVETVVNDIMYIKSPVLKGKALELFNESIKAAKVNLEYLSSELNAYAN